LALAVIRRLQLLATGGVDPEANIERSAALRHRFIGEKDPASLIESSKLFLNETDNAFYQDYLVQLREPLNPRGLAQSNRLLWECFQWFTAKLDKEEGLSRNGAALTTLLSEITARQLLFILITVDDELNAYTVFETLNARGLELSATDLLKNYLFSKVRVATDLQVLQRRWQALITTVRQERFPEFLRYHLLCEQPKIRSARLFKLVRDQVKRPEEVFSLLEALEARSELFAALGDVNHEYWIDRPESRPFIRELLLFRSRQMTPLLFAAWERFSAEDFARVVKLVAVITFRYSVVCGLNTNELEPISHRAAKAVLNRSTVTVAGVFDILRTLYVDDVKFKQEFANLQIKTSGPRRRLTKYILCRLEHDASNIVRDFETDPGTIEHILPENPEQCWELSIRRDDWPSLVYRLGNLTLLEAKANRTAGRGGYEQKRGFYENSLYHLARKVVEQAPEEWLQAQIEARQNHMANRAACVWRSDFV